MASSSSPQPPPQPLTYSSPLPPQYLMYKNRLQEFAQRSNIPFPEYQTTNEGTKHLSKFRATVWVDGKNYTSQMTFAQKKAAEQDAARIALENLNEKTPLVFEDIFMFKSIMNEYATKLNVERPTYNTVQLEGLLPRFMSFVIFNGTKYASANGKNKKEAEQLAARVAILSVLGDPSSTTLYDIIRSNSSFYGVAKPNESQFTNDHKDKEVPVATNNGEKRIDVVPALSNTLSSSQELQMPTHVPCAEGPFPPKSFSLQRGGSELGQLAAGDTSSSSSKRRKNKKSNKWGSSSKMRKNKKSNKRARLESMLPSATDPCSVAQ